METNQLEPSAVQEGECEMIHTYKGITPKLHPSVFSAPSAEIIGDVVIEEDSSVWYNAARPTPAF